MANVTPFSAFHYHPGRVKIERVVCPPYDVISEEQGRALRAKDPHNFVQMELTVPDPKNPPADSVYEQAAACFKKWTDDRILIRDPKDCYYIYEMNYPHPFESRRLTRLALFAALQLEPFEKKIVFPHEKTHATAKVDRAKLIRATGANFSPIFGLYQDSSKTLDEIHGRLKTGKSLFEFTDEKEIVHKLWFISDDQDVQAIRKSFEGKNVFIADGHHRYETALNYAKEKNGGRDTNGTKGWDYVMTAFVRFHDPGLLVLPIHRLILNTVNIDKAALLEDLKKQFKVSQTTADNLKKISEGSVREGFGLAFSPEECYLLELKDKSAARKSMPPGKPTGWYELDMTLVSHLILEPLLKIDASHMEQSVSYSADLAEVMVKLGEKKIACALIIRPIQAQAIKDICESGELMPQKSTFFYPKFPSGLLIYRH